MLRIADLAYRTDTGRQRNANEDSYFARAPVFVVADGMGGAQAGEVASQAAADAFEPRPPGRRRRRRSCARRSRRPTARSTSSPAATPRVAGMGTTITAAIVDAEAEEVGDRPRRRQPRLPPARRQARAAHPRPLAGRGDAAQGPAHRRAGRGPPAALDHHPRARPRARGRGRRADGPRPARRRLPALLGRADDDARRGADRAILLAAPTSLDAAVRALVDEANRGRRPRQHHRVAFRLEDAAAPAAEPAEERRRWSAPAPRRRASPRTRCAAAPPPRPRASAASSRRRGRAARAAAARPRCWPSSLVLAAIAFGAWYGNRQVWFLGTDDGGRVALYRGLPYELPFGIDLYDERYASPVQTDARCRRQQAVTDHDLRSATTPSR